MSFSPAFYEIRDRVRNWGRWGDDDQLGTLNLITDEIVVDAARLVETGHRISCALDLGPKGVQAGQMQGRVNPQLTMVKIDSPDLGDEDGAGRVPHFSDDVVTMALQAGTHWDGLAHVSYDGTLYNGHPVTTITAAAGATTLGIENVRHLTGRGVLLDVAAAQGVERLQPGREITPAELDAAAEHGRVEIRAGDIVLIRTGHMRLFHEQGAEPYGLGPDRDGKTPGPGMDAAVWFRDHDIAAVATDTYVFEVFPGRSWDDALALHCLDIVDIGLTQGQNWDLEGLSTTCAEAGRHEFLLSANPEPFVGGCGSPVNPVAIF